MKLATHDNALETNTESATKSFGIGDARVIIRMLRNNVYKHKIPTTVQEYMSNGRDAQREAKSTQRCIVTLPNNLNPVFKVRDFGPGITPHRMANVFTEYGNSTKRGTNGQTGGFGVGAKSAWAYTDSFTVVSITGGKKRTYVCHIGSNEEGSADLISEQDTTEATGTEIQIAVKPGDIDQFARAAFRACYFWKPEEMPEFKGSYANQSPAQHKEGFTLRSISKANPVALELFTGSLPDYVRLSTYHGDAMGLIVDGIPYQVDASMLELVPELKSVRSKIKCFPMIHVGNGVVQPALSREEIQNDEQTINSLKELAAKLEQTLELHIGAEFKAAKSNTDWIKTYNKYTSLCNVDTYSKRGDYAINQSEIESALFKDFDLLEVGPNYARRGKGGFKRVPETSIGLTQLDRLFYVDDTEEAIVTQNRRVLEYLTKLQAPGTSRVTGKVMLLVPRQKTELKVHPIPANSPVGTMPKSETITLVTLAKSKKTVKAVAADLGAQPLSTLPYTPIVRVPKAKRDRTKEMFTLHEINGIYESKTPRTVTLAQVHKTYLYIEFGEYEKMKNKLQEMSDFASSLGYDYCALTKESIRFVQGEKRFTNYHTWLQTYKIDTKMLNAILSEKALNKSVMQMLSHTTVKMKDKEVLKMIETYRPILKSSGATLPPKSILDTVSKEIKEFKDADEALTDTLKTKYPLLSSVTYSPKEEVANEVVLYMNMKF